MCTPFAYGRISEGCEMMLLHAETPAELFRELVEKAIARQGVSSSEMSSYYLVQLLEKFVFSEKLYGELEIGKSTPLAEMLLGALASKGRRRVDLFRFTGDVALFVSGFFSDSLQRKRVDLDYYVRMGGYAYARAALGSDQEMGFVFSELSAKFARFVDVLCEVSEESSLAQEAGVLKLYEKWLQTGSRRSERLLRAEGILLDRGARRYH